MGRKINKDAQVKKLYEGVKSYLEYQLLINVYNMVIRSGVCPDTNHQEWLKVLCYMWAKGWVYQLADEGVIYAVAGAYRIKEFDENAVDVMPKEEEGKILYVPFCVSESDQRSALVQLLRNCLEKQTEVDEIIYYQRNTNNLKRIKLNKERLQDEQTKDA